MIGNDNCERISEDLIVVDNFVPEEHVRNPKNIFMHNQKISIVPTEMDEDRVLNVKAYKHNIDLNIQDGAFLEKWVFPIPEDATQEEKQLWYHPIQIVAGDYWDSVIKNSIGFDVIKSHIMAVNVFLQAYTNDKIYHYPNLHSTDSDDDKTWTMLYWAGNEGSLNSDFILFDNRKENVVGTKPMDYTTIPMRENRAVFFKSNRMWTKSRSNKTYAELEYAFTIGG